MQAAEPFAGWWYPDGQLKHVLLGFTRKLIKQADENTILGNYMKFDAGQKQNIQAEANAEYKIQRFFLEIP